MSLIADAAVASGYRVMSAVSNTCLEITGDGDWDTFSAKCLEYVQQSRGDHVSIIFRDPLGGRELRDIGERGERRGSLPHANPNRRGVPDIEHLFGVCRSGHRYYARIAIGRDKVYLGTFDDAISAGMAHDRYAVEHDLHSPLNFPHIRQLMKHFLSR